MDSQKTSRPSLYWIKKNKMTLVSVMFIFFICYFLCVVSMDIYTKICLDNLDRVQSQHQKLAVLSALEKQFQDEKSKNTKDYQNFSVSHITNDTMPDVLEKNLRRWQQQLKLSSLKVNLSAEETVPGNGLLKMMTFTLDTTLTHERVVFDLIERVYQEMPGIINVLNVHTRLSNDQIQKISSYDVARQPTAQHILFKSLKKDNASYHKIALKKNKKTPLHVRLECQWIFKKPQK